MKAEEQNQNLGTDEICVLRFLNNWPDTFVSSTEIARRADSKHRYREEPRWAVDALSKLLALELVATDSHGKYCVKRVKSQMTVKCGGKKRFIAPHLRAILEKDGRKLE